MNTFARMRWGWTLLGVLAGAMAQAQVSVGRTEGEASVTATGAARYVVPLRLPPGTNGLVPSLAVAYDSRSGNGLLGVGFRLSGLSVIHRCASTLAQDGRLAAVALDGSDRLCLDGQRLRLTAGSYGASGSQYQTEVESFSRVTAIGSAGTAPASFRVERRDGLVYEYGTTDDSRFEASGSLTPREWALSRIRDRDGNYIDFVYAEDTSNGAYRPLLIHYTGNLMTGAVPYYTIRFTYDSRPAADVPSGYSAGGLVSAPWRLDRIDVVHYATGYTVRTFDLAYDIPGPTGRSRLASLQECAGPTCLVPTRFTWTAVPAGWSVNMAASIAGSQYESALPGDVDGDGFDDLTFHDASTRQWMVLRGGPYGFQNSAVATGLGSDSDPSRAVTADLDGDGRREVLVPGSGGYWHRLLRTAAGSYAYSSTGIGNPAPPGGMIATDVDGDGRDDLVYVKTAGDAIYWRRNQTVSFSSYAAEAVLWSVPAGTRLPGAPFIQVSQRFRSIVRNGDVNGDGRADLVVLTQVGACGTSPHCDIWFDRWQVLASTGSSLLPQYSFDGEAEPVLGDFNADGLTDVVYWVPGTNWQLLLASGARGSLLAGFVGPLSTAATAPPATGRTLVIDWDADGRTDLLQATATGEYRYCRSTGASLEACLTAGITAGTVPVSPMTLDVNGDGYSDLMYSASGVRLLLHHQVPPDHLVTATDGLGAQSSFEYVALSNPGVHRPGSGATFPVRDVVRPYQVVPRATLAGSAGAWQETYFYEGAKVHAQGRGFLGFARRTVTPTSGHLVRVEEYLQDPQDFERLGAPSRVTQQQRTGVPVSRETHTWGTRAYGTGYERRAYAYPSRVTVERFELDGVRVSSATTDTTFDSFGTPLQRQQTTTEHARGLNPSGQHVETVALVGVVNDTVNWCLGMPATIQVTRQHSLPGGAAVTRTVAQAWDQQRCRPTQTIVEPGSETLRVVTSLAFDAYGNLTTATATPVGQPARTTLHAWSDGGRFLRSSTNPEGHVTTFAWDEAAGLRTAVTGPIGYGVYMRYDELGRPVREIRPDGTSTVFARVPCAGSCATTDARYALAVTARGAGDAYLGSTEAGFDAYGREVYSKRELPGGAFSLTVRRYDSRGLIAQESLPGPCCAPPQRWIRHAYDAAGRRTSLERPPGDANPTPAITRWRHDGLNVVETDPLGRSTTRRHDALGRVVQVVDPALVAMGYEYDAFGNLVKVRDYSGAETTITYDVRGYRRSIDDPNAGRWTYDYYPLGEIRAQTSPRGHTTVFTYDRLSRPVTRTEPEGTTTWTWGTSAANRDVGALASVSAPGYAETYRYDALGRLHETTTSQAGSSFVTRQYFDPVSGLANLLIYPASTGGTPLRLLQHYDRGRLVRVSDADTGGTYWQLNAVNSLGRVTDESLGNGVRIASAYDSVSGLLLSRVAGPGGGSAHQNLAFAWDAAGNLEQREERNHGALERFFYDNRDRLDYVTLNGSITLDVNHDDLGNVTYKSDVGTYTYDRTRKQAVVSAGANTYSYDAGGAVVNASGTTINWLSYDLPSRLTHPGGNYSAFSYGPDRARYRQVSSAGGGVTDTLYAAGGRFEQRTTGGVASFRHYIVADGRRVAVQTRKAGSDPSTVYLLEDHLGSVDGITSSSGALLARTSYRPHGARRSGNWTGTAPTAGEWAQIQAVTARGYTGHEHLDNLGIVHMNGRVYDPVLGRFLSPDPVVQAPYDTQGLNRYAYVRNNPLRHDDPSGFCYRGHPVTDHLVAGCLEEIVVTGRGGRELTSLPGEKFVEVPNAPSREAGGGGGSYVQFGAETIENIVVTGSPIQQSSDTSLYASLPQLGQHLVRFVESPYFGDLLIVAGVVLGLLEPTPIEEMLLLSRLAGPTSRALAPYYPSANGFIGATTNTVLKRGTLIDRFGGSSYSRFFSPVGTLPQARSLPPATAAQTLRTFEVLKSLQVEAGRVAPWFAQPGLGVQYRSSATLGEMIENQVLREIGP